MKSRRGRGEGSVFQRKDGLWAAQMDVGYDGNGKRRIKRVYAATKREVLEKLRALQTDAASGVLVDGPRITVAQFFARWLDTVRPSIKATTMVRYAAIVRLYINPQLGGVVLTKLAPMQIQAAYARLQEDGHSAATVGQTHRVLHAGLEQALKWGSIARNPAHAVVRPKVVRRKGRALSNEQVAALLGAAKGHRLFALFILAVDTGMRQGELFALHWEDVDLRAGVVTVRANLQELPGSVVRGSTKTEDIRTIKLSPPAHEALRQHRATMMAEGLAGSPWVFPDSEGGPLRKSNFMRRVYYPLLKAAGLPAGRREGGFIFHDGRVTSTTLLVESGLTTAEVMKRTGHKTADMVMRTYLDAREGHAEKAAAAMGTFWGGLSADRVQQAVEAPVAQEPQTAQVIDMSLVVAGSGGRNRTADLGIMRSPQAPTAGVRQGPPPSPDDVSKTGRGSG